MKIVKVKAEREYQVQIGINAVEKIKEISDSHNKVLLLAPNTLISKFKIKPRANLKLFGTADGENQKSLATLDRVWKKCASEGIKRSDAIIGLGGGATTDLAGFASATWMRGIDWYAMPTSLAGMVDASKCGFISDYKILNLVQDHQIDYESVVHRSIKVKADVVSRDFKENKLREVLNYGHTLGHAIEKESGYKLRHGEAVSIGMVFAAELSSELAGLDKDVVDLHRELLGNFDLPIDYPGKKWPKLLTLLTKDKKVKGSRLRFIGISKIGKPVWFEDVTSGQLAKVYERIAK